MAHKAAAHAQENLIVSRQAETRFYVLFLFL